MIMKRLVVSFLIGLALFYPMLGWAHDYTEGNFKITHPWARFTPPGSPNGAAYLVIENKGATPDRLIGAVTPRAAKVEIHGHEMTDDVMSMRQREAVDLPPNESVTFETGGLHLMLIKLTAPLKEGERFPLTLKFEKGDDITVDIAVERGVEVKMDQHHQME